MQSGRVDGGVQRPQIRRSWPPPTNGHQWTKGCIACQNVARIRLVVCEGDVNALTVPGDTAETADVAPKVCVFPGVQGVHGATKGGEILRDGLFLHEVLPSANVSGALNNESNDVSTGKRCGRLQKTADLVGAIRPRDLHSKIWKAKALFTHSSGLTK